LSSVEVTQEPVAGGHVLEPLALQAQGSDAGWGGSEEPVAVQLPGMAGDAQGEGLARPGPPDDNGDPVAALAQVADHRLLVLAGRRMRRQGLADRLMGDPGGLLSGPVGGADNQPLLDRQQLRGGPAALLQRPVGDHADRPLGQEPIRQPLQLGPCGPGQAGAKSNEHVGAGEGGRVRGQPVRSGQPVEQPTNSFSGHRPVLSAVRCPAGHLPDQAFRVHPTLSRLGPPASIQGVRCLMVFGLAGRVDGPLDQPRRPLSTVRNQPVEFGVDLAGAL
jgi:hypothetical protein